MTSAHDWLEKTVLAINNKERQWENDEDTDPKTLVKEQASFFGNIKDLFLKIHRDHLIDDNDILYYDTIREKLREYHFNTDVYSRPDDPMDIGVQVSILDTLTTLQKRLTKLEASSFILA
jgi:hypothetical protein